MPKATRDWSKLRETLIGRLEILASDDDSAVALGAIKTLLDLDPDAKADAGPSTPLFSLPNGAIVDPGLKGE